MAIDLCGIIDTGISSHLIIPANRVEVIEHVKRNPRMLPPAQGQLPDQVNMPQQEILERRYMVHLVHILRKSSLIYSGSVL